MVKQQRHYCDLTGNKLVANQCPVAKVWQPFSLISQLDMKVSIAGREQSAS